MRNFDGSSGSAGIIWISRNWDARVLGGSCLRYCGYGYRYLRYGREGPDLAGIEKGVLRRSTTPYSIVLRTHDE